MDEEEAGDDEEEDDIDAYGLPGSSDMFPKRSRRVRTRMFAGC